MTTDLRPHLRILGVVCLALLVSGLGPADSPVADAAMEGDREAVRSLVKQGGDVNAPQGDGMTALHWAAERGDTEIVTILIYAGANLEAVTRNGAYAPLHLASQAGKATAVALLLEAGTDPNTQTSTSVTPLHFAAASGSVDAIRVLLNRGADANAQESALGQTPLIFAAAENRAGAIEVLLAAGADPSLATEVVDVVARQAEDRELRELRNRRMEVIWGIDKPEGGSGAGSGYIPPDFGVLMGHTGGMTPLHHAAREGNMESVLPLLAGGAEVNQVSADGSTPLLTATINGHFDLAMRLLEHGAGTNIASEAGATPLYAAINLQWSPNSWYPQPTAHRQQQTSYLDYMEALLIAGANPNARLTRELFYSDFYEGDRLNVSQLGATPFWRAAYGADAGAMRLLVQYGADPMISSKKKKPDGMAYDALPDMEGYPFPPVPVGGPAEAPIHVASGAGYGLGHAANVHRHLPGGWMPAVRYLVEELGADVNARDHSGFTPLHNAASRGDTKMVLYLVAKGADVTAVSRSGQTTADMANGPYWGLKPFPETIGLLESLGSKNSHRCQSC